MGWHWGVPLDCQKHGVGCWCWQFQHSDKVESEGIDGTYKLLDVYIYIYIYIYDSCIYIDIYTHVCYHDFHVFVIFRNDPSKCDECGVPILIFFMYTQLRVLPLQWCVFSVNHRRVCPPPGDVFVLSGREVGCGWGIQKLKTRWCFQKKIVVIPTNGKWSKLTSTLFSDGLFNHQLEKNGLVVLHGPNIRWGLFSAEWVQLFYSPSWDLSKVWGEYPPKN